MFYFFLTDGKRTDGAHTRSIGLFSSDKPIVCTGLYSYIYCDRKSGKSVGVVTNGTYISALLRQYTNHYWASAAKIARQGLRALKDSSCSE